ncbi:MAG: hypothetical protein JRF05_03855 [Deltaproteobacteria bacterium]|jgi:ribonuclease BN (tRNA processing enzyme)/energy-coupling factor transporter ATP-binding protein EcfA2|nr:hypothetical protein [Deltaproteobacteria bacterium]
MYFFMPDLIPCEPESIAGDFLAQEGRILLFGESGSGKSTLAAALARSFVRAGSPCFCISADPGSPAFGVPGAVCLGRWHDDAWRIIGLEALCTLDSGRFRLPLVSAVRSLAASIGNEMLLIDAPGVVRSVAGAELLAGLADAADIDTILVLCRDAKKIFLASELKSLDCRVVYLQAPAEARPPSHKKRARQRTGLWDAYLHQGVEKTIAVHGKMLTGTPPPLDVEEAWHSRQIGLLKKGRTIAMGEVFRTTKKGFQVIMPATGEIPDQLLCRDALRNRQGYLATEIPAGFAARHCLVPPDVAPYVITGKNTGPCPSVRIRDATALLVNGVFGDPLLHLRFHNRRRSLLFDLGEGVRLPARLAHQVTDVFISHGHIDHISGFLWLLRSRIGDLPACNLFGPPGLADHIEGLISGIRWDRIGEWGPRFTVRELHGEQLRVYGLQAGRAGKTRLAEQQAPDGLLFEDQDCKVRAVALEHGGITVLAYSLELAAKITVVKEKLSARSLARGPWLGELKKKIFAGEKQAVISLPDNTMAKVGDLADELLKVRPPQKLVYATDLSDSCSNRKILVRLARGAHTFFCEAGFLEADKRYAEKSGHLTTHGCGEIALAADVKILVPFHFSRRYEKKPLEIYDEVKTRCSRVLVPTLSPAAEKL